MFQQAHLGVMPATAVRLQLRVLSSGKLMKLPITGCSPLQSHEYCNKEVDHDSFGVGLGMVDGKRSRREWNLRG
jgi:hypothetical protein